MKFKKFKKVIKDNIKRISCVVLSMLLLFTFTITSLAFDGEMDSNIDKQILKKYLSTATVLYNPENLPIYSSFNNQVLDLVSTTSSYNISGWELSEYEYLAVTQKSGSVYYVSYIIPQRDTDSPFRDFSLEILNPLTSNFDFPDFYESVFNNNFTISNGLGSLGSNMFSISNMWDAVFQDTSYLNYIKALIYCATISEDGTLLAVSETYYGNYNELSLVGNDIVQVYYHSSVKKSDYKITNENLTRQEDVLTKNLNYLVSTTTMASMGYDSFGDAENITSFYSTKEVPFTFSVSCTPKNEYIILPKELWGSSYTRTDGRFRLVPTSSHSTVSTYPYWQDEGMINSDRAFLFLPSYDSQSSAVGGYLFVFPEEKSPILYFKYLDYPHYGGSYSFVQVLSKVDYVLYKYCNGNLNELGSFNAETTTFTAKQATVLTGGLALKSPLAKELYIGSSSITGSGFAEGESANVYPFIQTYMRANGGTPAFTLAPAYMLGNKCSFSLFRSTSNNLGFYTYISPDIKDYILNEGGGIGDGSGSTPGTDDGSWEFTVEYDKLTNIKQGMPEPPDDFIGIFDIDISDFWKIPENLLLYFSKLIEYFTSLIGWFFTTYGGPISKMFMVVGVVFNGQPDIFNAILIISLILFLMMKLLQYSTITMDSLASYSEKISGSDKEFKSRKKDNKDDKKNKKDKPKKTNKKGSGE